MNVKTSILMGALIIVAGGFLYDVTFKVQEMEGDLARLNRQIIAEREQIQVLRAEWSVLNDIRRVEELALKHLDGLRPAEPNQFTTLANVPVRGAPPKEAPQIASLPAPTATIGGGDGIGSLIKKVGAGR